MNIGIVLVIIGLFMAWSGFSMGWKTKNLVRAREYGYHVVFRKTWWVPIVIGILLIITLE